MHGPQETPMPSPFPGMDPYIEWLNRWPDFHQDFLVRCREQLNRQLPAGYAATLGERVELIDQDDFKRSTRNVGPDDSIVRESTAGKRVRPSNGWRRQWSL